MVILYVKLSQEILSVHGKYFLPNRPENEIENDFNTLQLSRQSESRNSILRNKLQVHTWVFTSPPISFDNLKNDWIFPLRNYMGEK